MHARRNKILALGGCLLLFLIFSFYYEYHNRFPTQAEWIGMGIGLLVGVAFIIYLIPKWDPYNIAAYERTKTSSAYRQMQFWVPVSIVIFKVLLPRLFSTAVIDAIGAGLLTGLLLLFLFLLLKLLLEPVPHASIESKTVE